MSQEMDRSEVVLLLLLAVLVVACVVAPSWPLALGMVSVSTLLGALRLFARLDEASVVARLAETVAAASAEAAEAKKAAEKAQNGVAALASRPTAVKGY